MRTSIAESPIKGKYVLLKTLAIVTEDIVIDWTMHLSMSRALASEEQLLPLDAVLRLESSTTSMTYVSPSNAHGH
jgi:hypothetical protein